VAEGKYIVIEGSDGTGKSTQVELLATYLQTKHIESFVMHEPAGTPISDAIRKVIKDGGLERDGLTNLLLFTAARHENWRIASKMLKEGIWIISARNYISTEVYQGYAEGIDIHKIHEITHEYTDERYMTPDASIILTLDATSRKKRIEERGAVTHKDTFESRNDDFQEKLDRGYKEIAEKYGFETIDANQSIDAIQRHICNIIEALN